MKTNEIADRLNDWIGSGWTESRVGDLVWALAMDADLRGDFEDAVREATKYFAREMAETHPE